VQLQVECLVILHRLAVPVQAIDDHHANIFPFDKIQQQASELPGRELGGIDLLGAQDALPNKRSKIKAES
jgi:hypothetical protein